MVVSDRSRITAVNVFEQTAKTVNRIPDVHSSNTSKFPRNFFIVSLWKALN